MKKKTFQTAVCTASQAGSAYIFLWFDFNGTVSVRDRGNTYLTSLPLVSVRRHGRVTQRKSG